MSARFAIRREPKMRSIISTCVACLGLMCLPQVSALAQTMSAAVAHRWVAVSCPADAASAGATCGYVAVPLNRLDDDGVRINIYFEVYPHANPGPAISTIVPNTGGPGVATTGMRSQW